MDRVMLSSSTEGAYWWEEGLEMDCSEECMQVGVRFEETEFLGIPSLRGDTARPSPDKHWGIHLKKRTQSLSPKNTYLI